MTKEVAKIAQRVESQLKLPRGSILASTRGTPAAAHGRRIAMYLHFQSDPTVSWSWMGRQWGRDRSTVRDAVCRVREEVKGGLDLRHLRAAVRGT